MSQAYFGRIAVDIDSTGPLELFSFIVFIFKVDKFLNPETIGSLGRTISDARMAIQTAFKNVDMSEIFGELVRVFIQNLINKLFRSFYLMLMSCHGLLFLYQEIRQR